MSISARDLYFVLRVRNEASSVLTGVSRDILKIGAAAQASSARSQAAALRQQAALVRSSGMARAEALKSAEAATRETAARMRAAGATRSQVTALDAQARAYAREAAEVRTATGVQVAALHRQAQGFDAQAKSLERNVANHQRLARTMSDVSTAATFAGLAMVGAGAIGVIALLSTVKAAQEYDRQVALTKTQTDGFAASLKDLGQIGKDVGSKIAVPFEELQGALYDIFSSTNANMAQSKVLLESFAKAAVAGQVSIQDSSRSTIGIMNAFKIPFQDVSKVLDKQFQLVRKGVGTYGQFANVIGKLTPSAVRLGQNLDTMDAVLIFLTRNGLSAASAVAAGARAMDALSNPNTTRKLDQLGVASRDANGKFLPLIDTLKNLKKYLLTLPAPDRAKALFDIFKGSGGTIQAKRFFDLVLPTAKGAGNLDQFAGFLKDMKNSAGQFGAAYSTMSDTVAAKSQLLKNNWDIMKVTIGQALMPAFKKLLDIGSKVIGWFNRLSPEQQKNLAKWALIAAALITVSGVVVLIIAGIGALAAALAALGLSIGAVLLIVGGVVLGFAALSAGLIAAYKSSAPMRKLFADIGKTFSDVWTKDIQPFISGIRDAFKKDLLPAFQSVADVINTQVIPILDELWNNFGKKLVSAIGEVLRYLKTLADEGFKFISMVITKLLVPAIKLATDYYNKHKKGIDQVIGVLVTLGKWIVKIAGAAVIGILIAAVVAVIVVFTTLGYGVLLIIKFIGRLIGWVKDVVTWFGNMGKSAAHAATDFAHAIAGGFTTALNFVKSLPGRIRDAIGNLGSLLVHAGAAVIQGLINGISSRAGSLLGKARSLASSIKSAFNSVLGIFSPSRVMALSGKHFVSGIGVGVDRAAPALLKKIKALAGGMQVTVDSDLAASAVVPSRKRMPEQSRQVVFNIYTQEIRPEYHAQQLGQLMAGTM